MKKLLILLSSLSLVIFSFASCGGDSNVIDGPGYTNITGVLTEQAPSDKNPGTHLIMDDDLIVTPVNSIALNLSDPKYLNNKVTLLGVLNPDDEVFSVTGITVVEILADNSVSEDDKFIDYKNSDYGVELKYYSDWLVLEEGSKISFVSPTYENLEGGDAFDSIVIDQFPFSYDSSVFDSEQNDSPLAKFLATTFPEFTDMDSMREFIGKDRTEAVQMENTKGGRDYYMYRNGFIYKFSFEPFDALVDSKNEQVYMEMLSEFRFIGFTVNDSTVVPEELEVVNTDETIEDNSPVDISGGVDYNINSDLKYTYFESLPYSFKAQYPASWYYSGASDSDPNIRHHYGFSNESIENDNELISMDVVVTGAAAGLAVRINGKDATEVLDGDMISIYRKIDGQIYKLSGDVEYKDIILSMAASIEPAGEEL